MTVNSTRPSFWDFPGGATNVDLPGLMYNTVEFNNSVVDFLRQSARSPPKSGIGSTRAVFIGDTIELVWSGYNDTISLERWCLACTEPYSGASGWGACEDFSNAAATKLYQQNIGNEKSQNYTHYDFSYEDEADVSAAVCAFGIATNPFDLTVAYPFINTEREGGSVLTFSSNSPQGFETSPSQTATSTSPYRTSRTTSTHTASRNPSYTPESRHTSNAGTIAGAIIGALAGTFLLFSLIVCARKQSVAAARESQRLSTTKPRPHYAKNGNTDNAPFGAAPRPAPRPFVRDRISTAERGEVPRRTDTDELPPPAYEEVVVGAAREAADRERAERESANAREMARDMGRTRDRSADSRDLEISRPRQHDTQSPTAGRD